MKKTLKISHSNNRVGIGTINPLATLHVDGNVYVDTGHTLFSDIIRPYTTTKIQFGQGTNDISQFTGNVGIGTAAPDARLSIHDDLNASTPHVANCHLEVRDTNALAAENGGAIVFTGIYTSGGSHLGYAPYIKAYKVNATDNNYSFGLKFATRQNGVGSQVVAMTIDDQQRVGIGTTTPSKPLESVGDIRSINSGGTQEFQLRSSQVIS